jgi:cytochrome c-type biogenesis protein CcmH/NrfG
MKRESIMFSLVGMLFGILIGWIIGSQHAGLPAPAAAQATASTGSPASGASGRGSSAPALDVQRASELERTANAQPSNAAVRVELADVYFDAERFDLAVPWYEAALKLDSKNPDASTDLGVCYYYLNQADRALAQFDHSLSVDPKHVKTLLDQGIVRAFGKKDFAGAIDSWQKVIALAPASTEAQQAKQGIDGILSTHPELKK